MDKVCLKEKIIEVMYLLIEINDSYKLFKQLKKSKQKYLDVMNISPAFFTIVNHSLEYTFIMGLSKLYEYDNKTMSIHKIINICENCADLFPNSREIVYQGEDGNTVVYTDKITIDIHNDIREMRNLVGSLDNQINSLKGRRDKFYAHNDKGYFANIDKLVKEYPINYNDLDLLISTADKVLNKLLSDLCGEGYLTYHKDYNDIEKIMKILNVTPEEIDL